MSGVVARIGVSVLVAGAVALLQWWFKNRGYYQQHTNNEHGHAPSGQAPSGTERKDQNCGICNKRMNSHNGGASLFTLPCTHKFHRICLKYVFAEELVNVRSCPYRNCRRIVREYEVAEILQTA